MPEFEHDGWRLSYEERGSGPAVLLLHGLFMDRRMFDAQVDALSDRYRFITPDARSHGRSDHRAEPFTMWDLMEDEIALLDRLGIERPVWGGVSQGGFQSLRAALRHPERVAGLILIDASAVPEDELKLGLYEASAQVVAEEGWSEDVVQAAAIAMFGDSAGDEVKRPWLDRWLAEPGVGAVERMLAVTRREDLTDRLGEIDVPAVVIHGEEDFAIEMEKAEAMAAGLPNVLEFVRIPEAGHSSSVENPEAVTSAIERFLERVTGS
jgi:pimeloyl-ACP methyl ester carboxylesterase